ncbi:hypothetical protein THAOC_13021 [Thalassiosira oceanica]|uniref:HSF-type DNA-binding domain-containing protein n=1 Tax=Thalassiosira oceanica TaxID=159749 RepID=K0SYK6_THAOC|nr:hypothetical protein THAOC_13021 [Thalassiosira oceanica]|eukprot:EJK66076.1 hypothetical protein THAOC_13021 [Thalassiosira oceanica]
MRKPSEPSQISTQLRKNEVAVVQTGLLKNRIANELARSDHRLVRSPWAPFPALHIDVVRVSTDQVVVLCMYFMGASPMEDAGGSPSAWGVPKLDHGHADEIEDTAEHLASDVDRRIVVFGRGGRLEQEQRELEDGQAGGVQATDVVESPVPQAVALAPQAVLPLPLVLKSNSKISASWMTAKPARQPWEGINAAAATSKRKDCDRPTLFGGSSDLQLHWKEEEGVVVGAQHSFGQPMNDKRRSDDLQQGRHRKMDFDDTQPGLTGKPKPGEEYSSAAYRDYGTYLQNGGELITHKKSDRNFPVKLHRIVSDPLNSLIITWMPHGRAFKVLKRDELVRDVIPGYFDCAKYESFTRQLTAWDFRRCKRGPDQGCYYHEAFLRGLPELTCFIRRMPRHCRKSDRKRIEPEEEPAPPSHSTQQGERSSAHQQLELNEQAGQRDNEEKRRPGGDGGMLEGQMGDDFSSVPSGSSPPPYCNRGEYQSNEYLHHDQRKEGHSLGASAPAWGGVRPCIGDGDLWSTPCHGKERPPYDLGASTSEYQYKATPQRQGGLRRKKQASISSHGEDLWQVNSIPRIFLAQAWECIREEATKSMIKSGIDAKHLSLT